MRRYLALSWILILACPAFGTSPEAQHALEQGLALDSQGRYASSRDAYSQAIRLEPKFFEAWFKRGWARNRMGDSNGAVEDFDKALQLQPGNATAWNGRGAARDKAGNVAGALQDFQKAIDLDPTYYSPWAKRCTQAAHNCATKLAAAKPGSDEARYLTDLKTALEQGGKKPAEAVRTVRGLSGTELPVVLAQLGAPAK